MANRERAARSGRELSSEASGAVHDAPPTHAANLLPLAVPVKSCAHLLQDDIQEGLRYVFQTDSKYTLLASGTGHAGMESCLSNLVEPGDKVVIGNNGIWGSRAADMAGRYGGAQAPAAWLDPCMLSQGSCR